MKNQFSARVWELATSIPEGRVTTYGILAKAAGGGSQAARSVASILSKAPNKDAVPFHRIVYAGGRVWCTKEHENTRRDLYEKEGIEIDTKGNILHFEEILYYFD